MEVDLAAIRANAAALVAAFAPASLCAVVKADGYGHGDVPVGRGRPGGRRRLAGGGPGGGGRPPAGGRHRGPHPAALGARRGRRRPRWCAGGSPPRSIATPSSTPWSGWPRPASRCRSRWTPACTGWGRLRRWPPSWPDEWPASPLHLQGIWSHFAAAEEDPAFTAVQLRGPAARCWTPWRRRGHPAGAGARRQHRRRPGLPRRPASTWCGPASACSGCGRSRSWPPTSAPPGDADRLPGGLPAAPPRRGPPFLRAPPPPAAGATRPWPPSPWATPMGCPAGSPPDGGGVLIGGRRHPFAGSITMDQIVVDVGDQPVRVGDEVVLIGRQGTEEITADDWARAWACSTTRWFAGSAPACPGGIYLDHHRRRRSARRALDRPGGPHRRDGRAPPRAQRDHGGGAGRGSRHPGDSSARPGHEGRGGARHRPVRGERLRPGRGRRGDGRTGGATGTAIPPPPGWCPSCPPRSSTTWPSAIPQARPGPAEGAAAYRAATCAPVEMGNVGAGTGATVAGWRGPQARRKGGVGSAAVRGRAKPPWGPWWWSTPSATPSPWRACR